MCFYIYLFILYLFVLLLLLFILFFCATTISAIALSVAVVSDNCFMCYLCVHKCVCMCVFVRVCANCVYVKQTFFLRASLKFLETRPLRMFSNYKQFQCSSDHKCQIVAIVFVYLIFMYFAFCCCYCNFCIAKQKLHPNTATHSIATRQRQ